MPLSGVSQWKTMPRFYSNKGKWLHEMLSFPNNTQRNNTRLTADFSSSLCSQNGCRETVLKEVLHQEQIKGSLLLWMWDRTWRGERGSMEIASISTQRKREREMEREILTSNFLPSHLPKSSQHDQLTVDAYSSDGVAWSIIIFINTCIRTSRHH